MKIYVMTHRQFEAPEDELYFVLHVGRACAEDLGYPGDNTGDNISEKNKYYGELTGLYWVWKNVTGEDYLGLCHYRRFFINDKDEIMNEQEYRALLKDYDLILSKPPAQKGSYRELYTRCHNIEDLEATGEVIGELYPEYSKAFEEALEGTQNYIGNLFVTSAELFQKYCEWLFTIFSVLEKRSDVESYDDYHKRVFGFLSEQLIYVWAKTNNLSIYRAHYGITQEKSETVELKEQVSTLVKERRIPEAIELFQKTIELRPDVLLAASDLKQELKKMVPILKICNQELINGQVGMLDISTDMSVLMQHYDLVSDIIGHILHQCFTEEEISYLQKAHVSYAFCKEIILHNPEYKEYEFVLMDILGEILG